MSAEKSKPPVVKLHDIKVGQTADFFALLTEKSRGLTRDGNPFYSCRLKDSRRTVSCVIWADSALFADCEKAWQVGTVYKLRATFSEHERYGPQIDIRQIREVHDEDRAAGLNETDFFDRSRFDPEAMFAELRTLAEAELRDGPLRTLVLGLLDGNAAALKGLPATERKFYPFPGGWLEHVLNVTKNCLWLADQYVARFPELTPPLNRDLVVAGAILHDIGRAAEYVAGPPGTPVEPTIPGRLLGHIQLGRDLIRDEAKGVPDLNPELGLLLDHIVLTHLTLPEWGSPRLPMIPEVLILHHADDLDAKYETYSRHLTRDVSDGPFTERDPVVGKQLLKRRGV
jgi:3'-5' exoribonuclease